MLATWHKPNLVNIARIPQQKFADFIQVKGYFGLRALFFLLFTCDTGCHNQFLLNHLAVLPNKRKNPARPNACGVKLVQIVNSVL